jgi:hypothetical protein
MFALFWPYRKTGVRCRPLPKHPDQMMAAVLAGANVSEHLARHCGQTECVVEFAVCQQSRIGRDHGAAKLEHQAAVKIEPKIFGCSAI